MKKIVTIALVALMCAAIFAVDVSTSMRLGFNALALQDVGEKDGVKHVEIFDLDSCSTLKKDVSADAFSFSAGGPAGGFKINLNPTMLQVKGGGAKLFDGAKEFSFYVGFGNFKLAFGHWVDGIYYAEQCKKDHDDTNWSGQGSLASLYKMGLIEGDYGKAFDNLVDINGGGKQKISAYAEYKLAKVLPGNLYFTAALVSLDVVGASDAAYYDAAADVKFANAFGFRVAYQQNKVINVNFDLRFFKKDIMGFGVYVSPLMVKGLNATVGYTMILGTDDTTKANNGFGVDFRVRYEVIKGLTLTNQFNFTKMTDTDKMGIFDSFFALYKINSKIWASFDFQFDGDKTGDADMTSVMYMTPGCVLIAGDGCQISMGVQTRINNKCSTKEYYGAGSTPIVRNGVDIAIPVIARVKF